MKAKHELTHCPRCGDLFECKSGSITLCQCQTVALSERQLDFVAARFDDCLCAACLQALGAECDRRREAGSGNMSAGGA